VRLTYADLARGRACWSLYYLAIAAVYDPRATVTLWVTRKYCERLVGPRGRKFGIGPIIYKIRDGFFSKRLFSSVAGNSYLNADPAINDGPPMLPRDKDRQAIARSICVLSNVSILEDDAPTYTIRGYRAHRA
jgi:hypothetical protein